MNAQLHKGPLLTCTGCATLPKCATCQDTFTLSTALYYPNMFCSIKCEGTWLKEDAPNWDTSDIANFNRDYAPYVGFVNTKRKV